MRLFFMFNCFNNSPTKGKKTIKNQCLLMEAHKWRGGPQIVFLFIILALICVICITLIFEGLILSLRSGPQKLRDGPPCDSKQESYYKPRFCFNIACTMFNEHCYILLHVTLYSSSYHIKILHVFFTYDLSLYTPSVFPHFKDI